MARRAAEVLDHCLLRVQGAEATLQECVAENSEHAEVLEALLRVAAVTHAALAPDGPSPSFSAHSPTRVMNLARARMQAAAPIPPRRAVWTWRPAYRLAGVLLAVALLLGSAGVASASEDALPGDTLYGVKRGLERAALAISLSAAGDAELLLEHASRRIAEVEELMNRGRAEDIGPALEGYENAVQRGLQIASERGAAVANFETALGTHGEVLAEVLLHAPEQAVPGLTRALENSQRGQSVVEQIRGGQHPRDLAPDPSEPELLPGRREGQGRDSAPGLLRKTQTPGSNGSD